MKKTRFSKVFYCIMVMALVVSLCVCFSHPLRVNAAQLQPEELSLHKGNAAENLPFVITNMLPGDSKTQNYRVDVSYTGTVSLYFQASAGKGDLVLAEALDVTVKVAGVEKALYEGALAEMPELKYTLSTNSNAKTEEIAYEITVSMSKSAGNEYQGKNLTATLSWWAEGTQDETIPQETPGETGGSDVGSGSDDSDVNGDGSGSGSGSDDSDVNGGGSGSGTGSGGSLIDPPKTGDDSKVLLGLLLLGGAAIAIVLLVSYQGKKMRNNKDDGHTDDNGNEKKWRSVWRKIFLSVLLIVCFGVTTLALSWHHVTVEENMFSTGTVKVDLNGGKPVFDEDILFEPGMVIQNSFTAKNEGSVDVFYRMWFSKVNGDLAEALTVKITDGDQVIFDGILADLLGEKSAGANGALSAGQKKEFTITISMPVNTENAMQGTYVSFDLNLDAVQKTHNVGEEFQ